MEPVFSGDKDGDEKGHLAHKGTADPLYRCHHCFRLACFLSDHRGRLRIYGPLQAAGPDDGLREGENNAG